MYHFNEQLNHTRIYAEAFWNHEMIDRPFTAITVLDKDPALRWTMKDNFQACMTGVYDSVLQKMREKSRRSYYAGEALPHFDPSLGPDQYAAFLGGTIRFADDSNTSWVLPCVEDWEDVKAVIDRSENGYFNRLKTYYAYAAEFCKDEFMLDMLDLHSNMDALSALRGATELCYDLYDSPEEVMRVLNEVRKTYPEIFGMAYESGRMAEVGTISWAPIYCRGKSAVLQCDFSAVISPEMAKQYVFPAIREEAELLDHCIYHLDGKDALVHLDEILTIDKIDCIQWTPGAGQPRTMEWMDVLKRIQAAGKAVWIFDWTPAEVKAFHKELQPDKVAYKLNAETREEADELLEYLRKNT